MIDYLQVEELNQISAVVLNKQMANLAWKHTVPNFSVPQLFSAPVNYTAVNSACAFVDQKGHGSIQEGYACTASWQAWWQHRYQ